MKRFLLWLVGMLAVALGIAALGARFYFHSFLESDRCRQWLNRELSAAIHASGELLPVQASTGALYSDGFAANDGPLFRIVRADQIHADVRFGFWARSCVVDQMELARLRLDIRDRINSQSPAAGTSAPFVRGLEKRTRFELRRVVVDDLDLTWSGGELERGRLTAEPSALSSGEWILHGCGGRMNLGALPGELAKWRVESCDLRLHGASLFLTAAQLRTGEHGDLRLEGELTPGSENAGWIHSTFSGIPVGPWLSEDWRARLSGTLSGQLDCRFPAHGIEQSGSLSLADGELTALPLLDQIATVTRIDAFRQLQIHKASARVEQTHGTWIVTELSAESQGLLKVEGGFGITGGKIEGRVQLGVAPSVLQWVPGAKDVFTLSRDGFLWAPVHLTGPAAHPQEDLTARLAAATMTRTADDVRQSVRDSARSVLDLVEPFVPIKVPIPSVPGLLP